MRLIGFRDIRVDGAANLLHLVWQGSCRSGRVSVCLTAIPSRGHKDSVLGHAGGGIGGRGRRAVNSRGACCGENEQRVVEKKFHWGGFLTGALQGCRNPQSFVAPESPVPFTATMARRGYASSPRLTCAWQSQPEWQGPFQPVKRVRNSFPPSRTGSASHSKIVATTDQGHGEWLLDKSGRDGNRAAHEQER